MKKHCTLRLFSWIIDLVIKLFIYIYIGLNKFIKEANINSISAKMLAVSYFFLKDIPFIYQGQEIEMTNVKFESIDYYDDIASIDQYKRGIKGGLSPVQELACVRRRSRDNARTSIQWDSSENAGFTKGKPWLKVNRNYKEINVQNNRDSKDSLMFFYKKIIKLRKGGEY